MVRRATVVLLLLIGLETGSLARSRDFSAPPEVHEAPAPRGQGLYLSADLGLDGLVAHWRELALDRPVTETSVGFVLEGRIGVEVVPGVAAFLDARLRAPIVVPVFGLYAAEAGIGGSAILGIHSEWHADLALRHAWAKDATFCCRSQPDTGAFNHIWMVEVGFGPADRRGRVDRGWTLSLLGGIISSASASGWMVGLGIARFWSRW
jgi:hypothetical protein